MRGLVAFLACLAATLAISLDVTKKSHNVWLTRLEKPIVNSDWLVDVTYKLKKLQKNMKSIDVNFTLLQDISDNNIMCQTKVFQKSGGKFVKAPVHLPKKPCCETMETSNFMWPCLQKSSDVPRLCPIAKGSYQVAGFNPDVCSYPTQLPPNLPEEYKVEFVSSVGPTEIFKFVGYAVLKKTM